jgi:hypothetical protein
VPPSSLGEGYRRVAHKTDASFPLGIKTIENEHREVDTHLGSSQASTVGCKIRGEHISYQCLQ